MWGTDSEQHPLPPCAYQPKDPLIAGKTILSRSLTAHSTLEDNIIANPTLHHLRSTKTLDFPSLAGFFTAFFLLFLTY